MFLRSLLGCRFAGGTRKLQVEFDGRLGWPTGADAELARRLANELACPGPSAEEHRALLADTGDRPGLAGTTPCSSETASNRLIRSFRKCSLAKLFTRLRSFRSFGSPKVRKQQLSM